MADPLVRVFAEDGQDTSTFPSRGTWEAPFATMAFSAADLPSDINNGFNGELICKGGEVIETVPTIVNRSVTIGGIGPALGGFRNGSSIKRNHAGPLIEYDPAFPNEFEHNVLIHNIKFDGNKSGQPAAEPILSLHLPGFNTVLFNVRFADASGWGLEVDQGANSLTAYTLGFSSCALGAMKFESRGAAGDTFGYNVVDIAGDLQIDECAAVPILIDVNGASAGQFRSEFTFGNMEFETTSAGVHTTLVQIDSESTNPLVHVGIRSIMAIDSSNGSNKVGVHSSTNASSVTIGMSSLSNEHTHHYKADRAEHNDVLVSDFGQQAPNIIGGGWGNSEPTGMILGNTRIINVTGVPSTTEPNGTLALSDNGNGYIRNASTWKLITIT